MTSDQVPQVSSIVRALLPLPPRGRKDSHVQGNMGQETGQEEHLLQQGHVLTGMGERWLPLRESAKFQKAKKEKGLDKDTSLNTG